MCQEARETETKPGNGGTEILKKPLDKYPYLWYNTSTRGEENKVACERVSLNGEVLEVKVRFHLTKRSENNFPKPLDN